MDREVDGWMNRWAEGRMEGWRMDGGRMEGGMDRRRNGWTKGRVSY